MLMIMMIVTIVCNDNIVFLMVEEISSKPCSILFAMFTEKKTDLKDDTCIIIK